MNFYTINYFNYHYLILLIKWTVSSQLKSQQIDRNRRKPNRKKERPKILVAAMLNADREMTDRWHDPHLKKLVPTPNLILPYFHGLLTF